jgi:hypothetical protein
MESSPGMITRKELDESLERVMNNVLLEMKQRFDQTDVQFGALRGDIGDIRARLDRQAGLIQSGARALLRFDRWSDTADERIVEMRDHIQSLETRLIRLESRPELLLNYSSFHRVITRVSCSWPSIEIDAVLKAKSRASAGASNSHRVVSIRRMCPCAKSAVSPFA